MIDFRTPENVDESYPTVISAIEKDKIMEALITKANGREKVTLEYKEIKDLKISKDQFKMVIRQFKNIGLIENKGGYGDTYMLNAELHDMYRIGAFHMQEEAFKNDLKKLSEGLKTLKTKESPSLANKIDTYLSIIEKILSIATKFTPGGIISETVSEFIKKGE